MKKVIVSKMGGPEGLEVVNATPSVLKPGEIRVDVEAAGVNYVDIYQRQGLVGLPTGFTPGFEGVGVVSEIAADVSNWKIGDRVSWINHLGSYAQQITLPVEQAIAIPNTFTIDQAFLFQGVTAQYLLAEHRVIKPGDVVLVHAAAGGVGQLLVQWLKHLGAVVIGTASSEEKLQTIRSLGADHAVNYSNGFLQEVLDLTNGRGVDLALDSVGATTFASTVKALASRGMAILYGQASGVAPDVALMPLLFKGARVAGASLFVYIEDPLEMQRRAKDVIRGIQEGWLRAPKTTSFALDDVISAHHAIESRSTQGKLALIP